MLFPLFPPKGSNDLFAVKATILDKYLPNIVAANHHAGQVNRSEEHTSELQSLAYLVCRLLLEKKKKDIPRLADHYASVSAAHVHHGIAIVLLLALILHFDLPRTPILLKVLASLPTAMMHAACY